MAPAPTDVAMGLTQGLVLVVSRINEPTFSASEAPRFQHQGLAIGCIGCCRMASGYRPRIAATELRSCLRPYRS